MDSHAGLSLLIFTPTWVDDQTGEDAVHPDCEAAIKAQAGVEFDWHVTAYNPFPVINEKGERNYQNVLHQYQEARKYFLMGDWDALLTVEHDNVLPDDGAVKRMVDTPGDVIYAPYLLRHGSRVLSTWQYINDRNLGMSLSHYKDELRQAREQIVHRISGAGFGCTLMHRRVVEAVEFSGPGPRDQNWCPDLRFAEDCLRKYFVSNGRFDVPVLHWEDGTWLHPFQNRKNVMAKYIGSENMNAIAAGRFIKVRKDVELDLTYEEAQELTRMGAIRIEEDMLPAAEVPAAVFTEEVEIIAPVNPRAAQQPPARRTRTRTPKP